jgi:hypothetical protein
LNLLPIEFCEYIMSEGFRFKFVILKNFENNKMTNLNLKPSDIMYSQNSIGNKFKNGDQIGEVLDNIMEDRLSISYHWFCVST